MALMLSACASQSGHDELQAHNEQLQAQNQQLQTQNQQLQAQNQQLQAQVASLQGETSFVEAGDLLFPSGGYELSPAGKTELGNNIVPKLTGLQNAKVVVYGYTDSTPVGPQLKQQGINDNLTLSSQRAGAVVTYLKRFPADLNWEFPGVTNWQSLGAIGFAEERHAQGLFIGFARACDRSG